ncbi:MAG: GIY-YIG nuclease family protein [Bacteroidetes bacterium]|jgi:putative endonuclease|nr:MAG: GIY-YIG nuclease family protein [Bacteroidota bacterium]
MFYVYFLFSENLQQFYCGQTDNVEYRIEQHNSGETVSNKHGIPWILIGYIVKETRSEAMILERQVKKRGIRRWLEKNHSLLIKPINSNDEWMSG